MNVSIPFDTMQERNVILINFSSFGIPNERPLCFCSHSFWDVALSRRNICQSKRFYSIFFDIYINIETISTVAIFGKQNLANNPPGMLILQPVCIGEKCHSNFQLEIPLALKIVVWFLLCIGKQPNSCHQSIAGICFFCCKFFLFPPVHFPAIYFVHTKSLWARDLCGAQPRKTTWNVCHKSVRR